MDNIKVAAAAVLGLAAPSTSWFIDSAEPILKLVLLFGQIGVAIATIVYISYKTAKVKSGSK